MKRYPYLSSIFAAVISTFLASNALADHGYRNVRHQANAGYSHSSYEKFGRVVAARPIYRQIAIEVPRESCRVQRVAQGSRGDSFGRTVIGGLVGAAIGHELGNGRGSATAVGGLIGASIGNNAKSDRSVRYRDQEICRTQYRTQYEQRIVGYDVSYKYHGRIYTTRTNSHPGDRILIATR